MKNQYPELAVCELELRTLFTKSLSIIKTVSVTTFYNANNSAHNSSKIVELSNDILPEVQHAMQDGHPMVEVMTMVQNGKLARLRQ